MLKQGINDMSRFDRIPYRTLFPHPCSHEVWQTGLPWILFTGVFGAVNCPASRIKGNGLGMRDICILLPAKTPQGMSTGVPRFGITRVDGDHAVI